MPPLQGWCCLAGTLFYILIIQDQTLVVRIPVAVAVGPEVEVQDLVMPVGISPLFSLAPVHGRGQEVGCGGTTALGGGEVVLEGGAGDDLADIESILADSPDPRASDQVYRSSMLDKDIVYTFPLNFRWREFPLQRKIAMSPQR